jgi:hypothetical protein
MTVGQDAEIGGRAPSLHKEDKMAQGQMMAEEWLAKNRRQMISCPHQPGQLLISKKSVGNAIAWGGRRIFAIS